MGAWWTSLGAVLAVFAVMAAGAAARRLEWLTQEADRSLMAVSIRLLLPCLIFHTILGREGLSGAGEVLWPPLLGYSSVVLGLAAAWLWLRALGRRAGLDTQRARRTFALCVGVYNYSYVPIPLVQVLFPGDLATLAMLFLFFLGVELALWTAGLLALAGRLERGWWKRLVNPPSVSVVAAVLLNLAGLRLEHVGFLAPALGMLGQAFIAIAVLLVGATAADYVRHAQWRSGTWVVAQACILRLGVLPALFILAACLPWPPELRRVIIIEAAMPAAMFPLVMARYYGGDPPTAVRVVLGTSLVGLVTIPLWLWAGFAIVETFGR